MDFYERIKFLCKEKGVTVRQLIESVGMNYDSYNGLKRYNNFPRLDEAVKIAEKLDVTVYYLLNGIEYNSELTEEQLTFLELFNKLQDPCKQTVLTMMNQLSGVNIITPEN